MTDLKGFEPVQINALYGFENVKDFYWLVGYDVVNMNTGRKLKFSLHKGKFPCFSLVTNIKRKNQNQNKNKNKAKTCLLHHILALAYIRNEEFEAVKHIDGNPLNFDITNLKFITYSELRSDAYKRSPLRKSTGTYEVILPNGVTYVGSLKKIAKIIGVNVQTLYKRYYKQTPGFKIQSVKLVPDLDGRSTD